MQLIDFATILPLVQAIYTRTPDGGPLWLADDQLPEVIAQVYPDDGDAMGKCDVDFRAAVRAGWLEKAETTAGGTIVRVTQVGRALMETLASTPAASEG